jgi:hypothetical protein
MEELHILTNTTLEGNAFATKASWVCIRSICNTAYTKPNNN